MVIIEDVVSSGGTIFDAPNNFVTMALISALSVLLIVKQTDLAHSGQTGVS